MSGTCRNGHDRAVHGRVVSTTGRPWCQECRRRSDRRRLGLSPRRVDVDTHCPRGHRWTNPGTRLCRCCRSLHGWWCADSDAPDCVAADRTAVVVDEFDGLVVNEWGSLEMPPRAAPGDRVAAPSASPRLSPAERAARG